jgi:group I intron endonuclease
MLIYKVTNLLNKKCYIGKTIQSLEIRKQNHLYEALKGNSLLYFHCALRKYGERNFYWEVLGMSKTIEDLNLSEIACIEFFQSTNRIYGYNIKKGGDGGQHSEETKHKIGLAGKNRKCSDATKQKIRNANLGKIVPPASEELRRKRSLMNKGKHCSQEQKEKLRAHNLGKKLSQETIQKILASRKGYKHSEETKRKLSIANKGHSVSQETRKKISIGNKGKGYRTRRNLHGASNRF